MTSDQPCYINDTDLSMCIVILTLLCICYFSCCSLYVTLFVNDMNTKIRVINITIILIARLAAEYLVAENMQEKSFFMSI